MTDQVEVKTFGVVPVIDISRELEWRGQKIKVYGTPDEPWFHAPSLALALGYTQTSKAMAIVNNEDICSGTVLSILPYNGKMTGVEKRSQFVNESGLYSLILRSTLSEAKAFKNWITKEILPSIRRTGGFQINAEIQRLTSELSNQRLLTDNIERARKEAEEIAQAEKKRADDTESENKELRNAINLGIENQEKWNKAMASPPLEEKQYMYVATSTIDMMDSTFKIGGVAEVGGLQGRLNSYNSSRKEADPYFFIWYGKCHDYRIVENVFWAICERYRDKQDTKKEIVRLRIEHVLDVLENAIAGNRAIIDSYITKYSEFTRSTVIDGNPRMLPKLAVLGTPEKKSKSPKVEKIDASKLAATDLRAIIISAINNELRKTIPTYDFNTHSKTITARFNWVDISHAFSDYVDSAAWWRAEILKVIKNSLVHLVQRKSKAATITTVVTTATTTVEESIENESDEVDDS